MIVRNRVIFGYGTIAVNSNWTLRLIQIKPPQTVGSDITKCKDDLEFGESIEMELTYKECIDMLELLIRGDKYFEFKGVIFDFMNYNVDSVVVVKEALNNIKSNLMRYMAC